MNTYFPYSQIVDLYSNLKYAIKRHPFFEDWHIVEEEKDNIEIAQLSYGELYY